MSNAKLHIAVIAMCILSFILGWTFGYQYTHKGESSYVCQFSNMTNKYKATDKEVNSESYLITVTQGNRVFMFRRDKLTTCFIPKLEDT